MLLSWLFYALSGYFLQGLASVGDKIILKKIIPHPASYAFWQGVLSLGALLLIPFGFYLLDPIKAALFLMKSLFLSGDFINVYIWSRIGFFLGSLIFFILPSWRGEIFTSFSQLKKPSGGIYLILNKLLGAFGALAIYFAISKNTAALVSALQGFQFAIVFILVFLFSFFWPKIIKESFTSRELAEKLCGILLISAGLYYLSFL